MTTIVFPGQGSQFVGMSKDFYDSHNIARETFELIHNSTGIDIKDIIFNNSDDKLNQTQYTQLSIFCSSISIFNVLKEELDINKLNLNFMLGHSLGEYTALTAAGYLSIENCAKLLKKRGELMQNSIEPNKSGMAAIIGVDCEKVEKIINDKNLNIEIANDNSPIQVVISGKNIDIENSKKILLENGIKKFIPLNVSAAFHSKYMEKAEFKMKELILNTNFNESNIPIISNFSANFAKNIKELIFNLSRQMSNKVRWVESIKTIEKNQENEIIEIGPGKVLSGLIRRITNSMKIINIENISDIDKIKNEI